MISHMKTVETMSNIYNINQKYNMFDGPYANVPIECKKELLRRLMDAENLKPEYCAISGVSLGKKQIYKNSIWKAKL